MEYIVILITAPSEDEAHKLSRILVESHLAGCVNIIKDIRSIYFWKDNIEDEREVLLVAKARREDFQKIAEVVRANHSYTVPEIIALPVVEGSESYLDWLKDATKRQ